MHITNLSENDKNVYEEFVTRNGGSFLQSWDWGEWQSSNKRQATRYIVTDDAGNPILAAQFLHYTLPLGQEYLYCAYGPVRSAESRITNHELSKTLDTLIAHIRKGFPKALFVRLEPPFEIRNSKFEIRSTLHIQPGSTILLDISKPEEDLLSGMHPKTRYNIKVAQKHGVEVRLLTQPNDQHAAAHMMRDTLVRRKLVSPAQEYYFKLMGHFSKKPTLSTNTYGAYYNNELVACALIIDFNHIRTYLFGGSATAHKNVMAPYLLHWTIIEDAKNNGLHTYDWFGAEGAVSDGSGFARFKNSFGGETIQYAGAYDIIFKPLAYRAYQTTRHLNRWLKHR